MRAPAPVRSDARNLVGFAVIALIWGSTWLVIKDQISVVPAAWSVAWRFFLAAAGMAALAGFRGEGLRLGAGGLRLSIQLGVIQFAINFQLVYASEHYLTSGLVAVLFALMLVPNALLGRFVLGNQLTGRFVAGSGVALIGIALLLLHEYRAAPAGLDVPLGATLALCAVLTASIGNVLQAGPTARRQPVMVLLAWSMLFGALANAAIAWTIHGPPQFDPRAAYVAGIAYLAIAGSVVTFPLYTALLRDWGPGRAAYNGVAVPVVAMALSTLFEGFRWSGLALGGATLALAGLMIALSGRKAGG